MANSTLRTMLRLPWRIFNQCKIKVLQRYNRLCRPPKWHNLRSIEPISKVFGFDRGTPIDRIYTNDFLQKNAHFIQGRVCEIAENTYTKTFGSNVTQSEILHYTTENKNATIIGDLTQHSTLPQGILDCFICTVTLNFIYDYKAAIKGIYLMLKSNGGGGITNSMCEINPTNQSINPPAKPSSTALVTVAGLVQISQYDYERWGDYWRFTDMGIKRDFEEVFGKGNVEVGTYGNVLATMAELQGIAAEELKHDELFYNDSHYPVLITIVAKKY